MLKIKIIEDARDSEEMADVLDRIAELLRQGYTSGYGPDWNLSGDEEAQGEEGKE